MMLREINILAFGSHVMLVKNILNKKIKIEEFKKVQESCRDIERNMSEMRGK